MILNKLFRKNLLLTTIFFSFVYSYSISGFINDKTNGEPIPFSTATISYIDLPHDNLGLAPLEFYTDPYFLVDDIEDNGVVLFESGCYTDDPTSGGSYINDFDVNVHPHY